MSNNIDIIELANNPKLSLSITSAREENDGDAKIRRFKDVSLFVIAVTLVLCVFIYCGYVCVSNDPNIEDKKWATTIGGSIVSALLGYLFGRKTN